MTSGMAILDSDVLIAVDVQYDFCPGGRLPVPNGDQVVQPINTLARHFRHVILTQDWHPPNHLSFASSHPGHRPFETVLVSYGPQVLWPDHCIQGTPGAELHADLHVRHAELILRKGYHPQIDSYSVFFENDRKTPTGLYGYLSERGLSRAFFAGLALDFCVRWSVEDAYRIGIPTVIVEDACRGLGVDGSLEQSRQSIAEMGTPLITVSDTIGADA